jgi:hypothetical protein
MMVDDVEIMMRRPVEAVYNFSPIGRRPTAPLTSVDGPLKNKIEGPMCHNAALVKGLLQKLPFKLEALTTKVAFKIFEEFFNKFISKK